ncbi:class I adenylate-forming enzyme family protein [Alkalihalobacillus sp. BA299]|uniref:class I adenylate-forming enzyme family protein n=1 Tax=Alkalihalobacillus sp. BA299 TaxID=2815938 RepID=UPI001ADC99ED|nr:class I adenylate-forming enzyme family protein [Alkalihalobacillus sp. BA299]
MIVRKQLFNRDVKVYNDRPKTVSEMFEATVREYPQKEALIMGEVRQTYKQVNDTAITIAKNLFYNYKIEKGDRVAILVENCLEFVHVLLACAKLGAVIVPLNSRLSVQEITFMLNHSNAKALITEKGYYEKLQLVHEDQQLTSTKVFFIIDEYDSNNLTLVKSFSVLNANVGEKSFPKIDIEETDPLFIMYTSGTTGTPKGAIGSHVGIIHSALNYKHVMNTNETIKTLIAIPLFHVTGLIGQLIHMTLVGGTSVILKRYRTEEYLKTMETEKINFLFNVPTIYVMLLSSPHFKKAAYNDVSIIAYGGAPMSYETIYQLRREFPNARLHNAYGATETSSPTTLMPIYYPDSKASSVGLPVPVAEIKVVNEEGEELATNEVGELLIKGPMVIEGYWDNPKANNETFVNGFWKSGDLAMIDDDGYVYIMDRKKDMINRGGEKIYSAEVENVIYGHLGVLEAAVVGIPDQLFGEQVKAYIVTKNEYSVTAEDIQSYLSDKLADYKIPKEIEFLNELPRNPGGKVLKTILSKLNQ